VQTGKMQAPPIVLVGRDYWRPLIGWLRDTVLEGGKISEQDLTLFALADTEADVSAAVAAGRI
jgi:predicted Rossmann-fold nucleotide-binding protein